MNHSTNNSESESQGLMSRVKMPLILVLGLFLALGAYYFLYAQKKTSYLVGRNFRLLAAMGDGIKVAVSGYGKFVENQTEKDRPLEIAGLKMVPCNPPKKTSLSKDPRFQLKGAGNPLDILAYGEDRSQCGELDLGTLFEPVFKSNKGAFDGLLLAKKSGEVVYQHEAVDLGVTDLGLLLTRDGAKETASFSSAASYHNVEIGGREYKLFIQPISLPFSSIFTEGTGETWLLCGLVAADKFVYKSLAISSSVLLLILAPLLLSALAWPLIRLRLIGELQRIRVFDVLLLGICSLLGVAILTLSLLDFYAYAELKSVSQEQLRGFAEDMASDISDEIASAHGALAALQQRVVEKRYTAAQKVNEVVPEEGSTWNRFALVDLEGQQKLRWTQDNDRRRARMPRAQGSRSKRRFTNVQDREYFKRVRDDDLWSLSGSDHKDLGAFFVESVRGRTSNRHEAVLAEPVIEVLKDKEPAFAVATLNIPMRSVIEPVIPPGFEFAVIDSDGSVLFHSNTARNGAENFFTETDEDQRVRSAVFARRAEEMRIRYFGEDYMAMVQPVRNLPWTVVALRDEEQLQGLNMGWVVTTLLFLLLTSSPFVLALLGSVIARPEYRAPWLWPDPHRAGDYMNLSILLALYCLAFGVAIQHLPETGQLLGIAWTLPFFALLTCYVRLQARATQTMLRKIAVSLGYGLLSSILLWTLFADRSHWRDVIPAAVALLIFSISLLSARQPERWKRWAEKFHLPVARAYPLAALLLVVLTTVLPTLGIFKAVHQLQLHSFIRHGQLKIARELAKQGAAAKGEDLGDYSSSFFETQPLADKAANPDQVSKDPLPEFLEDLLPHYSVHSAEMRELLHDHASDGSWDSHRVRNEAMDLHFRDSRGSEIRLRSAFPRLFAGTPDEIAMAGFFGESSVAQAVGAFLSLCLFLLFLSVLFRLVLFISQRLFLADVREPLWTVEGGRLAPIAGRNLFLVRKSRMSAAEAGDMGLEYLDLGQIDAGESGGETWARRCRELVDSGSNILVMGFEHRISDPSFNARKLELLETLIGLRERSLIVLSQVSPTRLFAIEPVETSPVAVANGSLGAYDRWRTVLSSFTLIEEDLRTWPAVSGGTSFWSELLKPFLRWRGGVTSEMFIIKSPVLREESGNDPFLLQIAQGVDGGRYGMGREQLLEEFGERAEGYYRAIWESCSGAEKVVLQHLAQEGLLNEKNRRVIRRLMARGLIRRGPSFCLFNESFRRFACSALCKRQVLALEQSAVPSAWDRFRWPFLTVLSASIAFFFATQQQLLDSTLAAVTGLAAGLPAVVKIIDFLGGRRSATQK